MRQAVTVAARPQTATAPVQLISLEETPSDPPSRSKSPSIDGLRRSRSRRVKPAAESTVTPADRFSKRPNLAAAARNDSADEYSTPIDSKSWSEDAEDFDSDDDTLRNGDEKNNHDTEDRRFTFREDASDLFPVLFDDAKACVTWPNAIILGAAAGGALAIREHLDGKVRDYTNNPHPSWGEGSEVLRQFGEFSYQVPAIAAVYGLGLWTQDEHTHEFSKTLISAYSITALTTVAIKGVTNTNRPTNQFQNGEYGFPSFHTASTFSIAAVVDEYYGWPAGLPCYALAGLVGWSRIDQREHDLSDVVFGSILGFVIGKSISAAHTDGITGCQIVPCYEPATRSFGALFHKKF
jgi:PAP2 superfamily